MRVVTVPQLEDNYAYLLVDERTGDAAVVDCGEAAPVLGVAEAEGVKLKAALATHHHSDHVAGIPELAGECPGMEVYGGGPDVPAIGTVLGEGDVVRVGALEIRVLSVPGHTNDHLAYCCEGAVLTGDTLFACGCGRLFEGDAGMMLASLDKLRGLPDGTKVYFGHEYTETNLRFARMLEPENPALLEYEAQVVEHRGKGEATTPTTIRLEKETNPFLRCRSPELRAALRRRRPDLPEDDAEVFAFLRAVKDAF